MGREFRFPLTFALDAAGLAQDLSPVKHLRSGIHQTHRSTRRFRQDLSLSSSDRRQTHRDSVNASRSGPQLRARYLLSSFASVKSNASLQRVAKLSKSVDHTVSPLSAGGYKVCPHASAILPLSYPGHVPAVILPCSYR
jgi:hypothetical protein